ncbi:MAG: DUF1573 domain-containing protein [Phycisphaerales bacterium]|nr:DUF1573 domain-containing protein [Phycisphaerales bacterium]MCB9857704.1 DUF1573 domain-containing protein [Phycisphaerales bacterium]MCB9864793.1 DUF1573 domain-containing protein [Phycisphaerales bacterium]
MNTTLTRQWITALVALCVLVASGCDSSPAKDSSTTSDKPSTENSNKPADAKHTSATPAKPEATPAKTAAEPAKPTAKPTPPVVENRVQGPSWQALEPSVYDFGLIWVDTTVTHDFRFKNVGTEPLMIVSPPKAHCSCSSAGEYTKVVQPGEEGVVPYILTTKNTEGDVARDLKVTFNDPLKPEWTLYMKGRVKHVCSIDIIADGRLDPNDSAGLQAIHTRKANFEDILEKETLFRVLRLQNTSGHSPLQLRMLPMMGGRYEATLREITPGETFELTLVGSPPWVTGYNNGLIRFETNVPERPTWSIPIYARLPERIEISPPKIVANMTNAPSKTRTITIKNHGDTPVKVTSIACSTKDYQVTLLPPDPASPNNSVIEVVLPSGNYLPPAYGEVIRIETTDAEKALVEVMVLPGFGPATPRPADMPLEFFPGKMLY